MELSIRFESGLTIVIWPRFMRVVLYRPLGPALTLSLREFETALEAARKERAAR